MRPALIIWLSVFLFALPVSAQKSDFTIHGLTQAQSQLVLTGIAHGLGTANFFARMEGQGFYCPPRRVLTTPELVRDIADEQLSGAQKPDVIAIAAFDGLRKRYPCK